MCFFDAAPMRRWPTKPADGVDGVYDGSEALVVLIADLWEKNIVELMDTFKT